MQTFSLYFLLIRSTDRPISSLLLPIFPHSLVHSTSKTTLLSYHYTCHVQCRVLIEAIYILLPKTSPNLMLFDMCLEHTHYRVIIPSIHLILSLHPLMACWFICFFSSLVSACSFMMFISVFLVSSSSSFPNEKVSGKWRSP